MKKYKYVCSECKREFETNYKKINANNAKCFCSNQCRANKIKHYLNCTNCNKLFYATWIKRTQTKISFCTKKCYWEYKKKTGYGANPDSLARGRKNANTLEAIKKRKTFRIAKGTWLPDNLIIEGLTYKQYRRKVYRITKNLREVFYNNWNGYDYYDGEYIKNNFHLHYLDGDYPSIDHKISVVNGFKSKIPPTELCEENNLVVTKRRINSAKGSK